MLVSSQQAAACLRRYGATACTDLTGFGIVGHLIEMTRASAVDAILTMDAIPLLDGALETVEAGILSSLQAQNLRLRRAIQDIEQTSKHPVFPLIFDPQTAGGLLAGVPNEQVGACIDELHVMGYSDAVIIGQVDPLSDQQAPIRIQ